MSAIIVKRVAVTLISLLIISALSFALMELAPGDALTRYAENPRITRADREKIAVNLGLDKPAYVRYVLWLKHIVRGDMGISFMTGRPVSEEILSRLPATLKLMGFSLFISLAVAVALGVYSATHKNTFVDHLISFSSFLGISIPSFWFGLLMIYIFALWLRILPAGGYSTPWFDSSVYPLLIRPFVTLWSQLRYILMPAAVLSLANIAAWSRYVRSAVWDELQLDYIRTARAKGLPEKQVIYRHALRNALTPMVTLIGLELPQLFAGAVVTEHIFAWPGMGRLFITALDNRDYQVLMGIIMITAILVILGNYFVNILYVRLDPRVRYNG